MSLDSSVTDMIEATRAGAEVRADELDHAEWRRAAGVPITRYWSGAEAPAGRRAEARLLWTPEALSVRFVCRQAEPLVVSAAPRLDRKTIGLWDRDVCEIFLAPDPRAPERYFEFEAAPTGEWLDLGIRWSAKARETDWEFRSGMTAAARVEENIVTIVMRVPWAALIPHALRKRAPGAGARWRANLYRCVGAGETRGYLAWQPTETAEPNFHVPQKFGWLHFA
ncbi:MAG: carbohydrate-binding family 9-like protein [Pyrinomonadaceae bacterium]